MHDDARALQIQSFRCEVGAHERLDAAAMGLGDGASRLSKIALLIEEFLAREEPSRRLAGALRRLPEKHALLHGHCHQKAFDAVGAAKNVLGLIPKLDVQVIDSSCCGMAGSFGFDAAHYDVSMRMAELSLLPAVRAAPQDTLIVADGTSCRHQIEHLAPVRTKHMAELLAEALV